MVVVSLMWCCDALWCCVVREVLLMLCRGEVWYRNCDDVVLCGGGVPCGAVWCYWWMWCRVVVVMVVVPLMWCCVVLCGASGAADVVLW